MTAFQRWLTALLLVTLAVVIAYQWLDSLLVLFVHAQLSLYADTVIRPLVHFPDPLIPAAVITFVVLGLWTLAGRTKARLSTNFVCSLSVTMVHAFKNLLKLAFGRT